jgi:methenyltetrahydromethanopterin cyclohydrolase
MFKDVAYDFYKIDGALFAPAEVWVSNLDSGSTFHAGGSRWTCCARTGWLKRR